MVLRRGERGQSTEFDADTLHTVMGAAMAGMLVARLNVLPDGVWVAVFSIGAAWFGWHALRAAGLGLSGGSPCRFPVPHLIECVAMLYMLLPVHAPRLAPAGAATGMAGMGPAAGPAGLPALAIVLALFMLGYIVWTTDRLTALARAKATAAGPRLAEQGDRPVLAPTRAACGKLAMGLTMGYLLLLTL